MKKGMKIGIVMVVIIISSITVVASTLLLKKKIPIDSIENPDLYINTFDDIDFKIETDKDVYSPGQNVRITAVLENNNNFDKNVFPDGWEN